MTVRSDSPPPRYPGSHGHAVHFSGSGTPALARAAGDYFEHGLLRGDGLVIVTTPEHRDAFLEELTARGCDPVSAVRDGRLVLLDSQATLDRFLIDGQDLDPARFQATVRPVLQRVLTRCGAVRAYGDMVSLLWASGRRDTAIALEGLWNDLQASMGFELFCSYAIDVFGDEFRMAGVDGLLCAHTDVVPSGETTALERALDAAMAEVLGVRARGLRPLITPNFRPAWAALPGPESAILWLRNNIPDYAESILARAREHYEQAHTAG